MRGGALVSRAPLCRLRTTGCVAQNDRIARRYASASAGICLRVKAGNKLSCNRSTAIRPATCQPYLRESRRTAATVSDAAPSMGSGGPLAEYDRRVDSGILRNDERQRGRSSLLNW